jgi:multisubunit Na+/H+ antiporter MnhE subunit
VTATPGTVVVDVDERSGGVLLHDLGSGRPALEEVVRR